MKTRLALLAAGSAALFMVGAAPASADNGPHHGDGSPVTDGCAACHRVHTAKAPQLLIESTVCLSCHGSAAPGAGTNVVDGLGYDSTAATGSPGALPGALRGGGFESALIGSGAPTGQSTAMSNADGVVPVGTAGGVTSKHSVDTSATAWGKGASGAGATIALTCTSCHDPHGNGNYRILKPIPKQSGVTLPGVEIEDATTKVYTTTNYWKVNDTNTPNTYIGNVSTWCTTCHTRYLAPSGSGSSPLAGDAIFSYRHKSDGQTQGSTSCIQCHVSHGSNASMGPNSNAVEIPGSTEAANSSRLLRIDSRGTCQMCHNR